MRRAIALLVGLLACGVVVASPPGAPEDQLRGQLLASTSPFPTRWTSATACVASLRAMNAKTLCYPASGELTVHLAAFFARPVNDAQVELVVYEVVKGGKDRRSKSLVVLRRGDRVLFWTHAVRKSELPPDRRYRLEVQERGETIAAGELIVR